MTSQDDKRQQELTAAKVTFDRKRRMAGGALIALLALGAVIYAMTSGDGNRDGLSCAADEARLAGVEAHATGEVAALIVPKAPTRLPELAFVRDDGSPVSIADFNGKVVLLNLWATWCAPCRKEMPALDRLQATLGGEKFEVVAVNIDTNNADKARDFLEEIGVRDLPFYSDSSMKIFRDLRAFGRAFGMPTTVLIDEAGCELGTMAGPAEWDSRDALSLISAAVGAGN